MMSTFLALGFVDGLEGNNCKPGWRIEEAVSKDENFRKSLLDIVIALLRAQVII
jgi:hypothetical protein